MWKKQRKNDQVPEGNDAAVEYNVGAEIDDMDLQQMAQARLSPEGPKRILSLDGGGIRGAITLGILEHVEDELGNIWKSKGRNKNEFRLWHYFDLIVGTSTGAIIATLLAAGLRVADIQTLYKAFSKRAFTNRKTPGPVRGKFLRKPLIDLLESEFARIPKWPKGKGTLLADAHFRTGWGIVIRCLDTDHTWFVHNNNTAKYYAQNSVIPLAQLVRSSTAAAPYFNPELLTLAGRKRAFADGGFSAFNNPALAALVLATLKEPSHGSKKVFRGFRWELGNDKILLTSVGTGWLKESRLPAYLVKGKGLMLIRLKDPMLEAFMGDANFLSQAMLLWMSNSETRRPVHGAAEDFSNEHLHPLGASNTHFLTYLRYNVDLHAPASYPNGILSPTLAPNKLSDEALKLGRTFYDFTKASNVDKLLQIGQHCGATSVKKKHFPQPFTPKWW